MVGACILFPARPFRNREQPVASRPQLLHHPAADFGGCRLDLGGHRAADGGGIADLNGQDVELFWKIQLQMPGEGTHLGQPAEMRGRYACHWRQAGGRATVRTTSTKQIEQGQPVEAGFAHFGPPARQRPLAPGRKQAHRSVGEEVVAQSKGQGTGWNRASHGGVPQPIVPGPHPRSFLWHPAKSPLDWRCRTDPEGPVVQNPQTTTPGRGATATSLPFRGVCGMIYPS